VAFDRSRPVAWKILIRWAVIITVILNIAYLLFARDQYDAGLFVASLFGGAAYVGLGALLSKFGWQPPQTRVRQQRPTARTPDASVSMRSDARPRPAPTRRTNAGNRRTPPKR
jgi:hypothetical protein